MHPNQSSSGNEVNSSTPILFAVLNHRMVQLPMVFLIMLPLVYNVVPRKSICDIFLSYCKSVYCSLDLGLSHFGKNILIYSIFHFIIVCFPTCHLTIYLPSIACLYIFIYHLMSTILSSFSILCAHSFICMCVHAT